MRRTFLLAALAAVTACNSGPDRTTNADTVTTEESDTLTTFIPIDSSVEFLQTYSSNLQPWLEQTTKQKAVSLSDFKYADNWVEDSLVVRSQNLEKDFLRTYQSVLVYSPDNQKVLDLGTYGSIVNKSKSGQPQIVSSEPDVEVAVIDLQNKKRRRIFFSGPSTLIEKGIWMNDSTVLLAGKSQEAQSSIPMLWEVTIGKQENLVKRYEYTRQ